MRYYYPADKYRVLLAHEPGCRCRDAPITKATPCEAGCVIQYVLERKGGR